MASTVAGLVLSEYTAQLTHLDIQVGDLPLARLTLEKVEKQNSSCTEAWGGRRGNRDLMCLTLSLLGSHPGTPLSLQGLLGTQDKCPHFPA